MFGMALFALQLLCLSLLFLLFFLPHSTGCDEESFSFKISASTASLSLWTTTPSRKIFENDPIPTSETQDTVKVYCAKNEYEPFVVAVNPSSATDITLSLPPFSNPLITVELFQQDYVQVTTPSDYEGFAGRWPDPLVPIEPDTDSIALTAGENHVFWFVVHVPFEGVDGKTDHCANVTIAVGGGPSSVVTFPVCLHVFNFAVPKDQHIETNFFSSDKTIMAKYGADSGISEQFWKYFNLTSHFMMRHRMQLSYPLTPTGLSNAQFDSGKYDCGTKEFVWEYDSNSLDQYDFQQRAPDLLLRGRVELDPGIFGFKFPYAMFMYYNTERGSADGRPSDICGVSRQSTDLLGSVSSPYNREWGRYLQALERYLMKLGIVDKIYFYITDEPMNQDDYDGIASLTSIIKYYAPRLKLFVTSFESEDWREQIYANPNFPGGKIDIWAPLIQDLSPANNYFERRCHHGEKFWTYGFSDQSPDFSLIMVDHQGIDSLILGFFLWRYRVDGILYYAMAKWNDYNPWTEVKPGAGDVNGETALIYPPQKDNTPCSYGATGHRLLSSIRVELLRDSLEMYEYLRLLNGGHKPSVLNQHTFTDEVAKLIAVSRFAFLRDDHVVYNLRREIGLYLGGEISELSLDAVPCVEERCQPQNVGGSWYINFQDLSAEPLDDPLVVDGKTWIKVQRDPYDAVSRGYGYHYGSDVGFEYQTFSESQYPDLTPLQRTTIKGRRQTFIFALPNGKYKVTVSIGTANWGTEENVVRIQGIYFFNRASTGRVGSQGEFKTETREVVVKNHHLFVDTSRDRACFLNYLMIEYVDNSVDLANPVNEGDAVTFAGYGQRATRCVLGDDVLTDFHVTPARAALLKSMGITGGILAALFALFLFGDILIISLVVLCRRRRNGEEKKRKPSSSS